MVADGGGEAWLASRKNGLGKLHHKLMVIDGAVIICGSFNYTDPANRLNDENILVIGDLEDENPLAQAARSEVRRVGKECVRKGGVRWERSQLKKKYQQNK